MWIGCAVGAVVAGEKTTEAEEYRISCASCHGLDGKGEGSMASILTVKPSDLTTLARRHQGHFPTEKVYKMIDGREAFYAHGNRTMPVWGIRYLKDHALRYGDEGGEQTVQAHILKLVEHIRSIQE
ncbi:MAG: cytochrome c [Gammaproteobacteria bacterium]|nr:cytochrome c [Gammaproteobacteria bacterium]